MFEEFSSFDKNFATWDGYFNVDTNILKDKSACMINFAALISKAANFDLVYDDNYTKYLNDKDEFGQIMILKLQGREKLEKALRW